jgi:hypothetical protein
MPSDHSSSDFADSAYDLRAQAIRARLYACLWGPQDEASGRLLALADELETRADAAERAPLVPALLLALASPTAAAISGRTEEEVAWP